MSGTLYICGTPIGNLKDISLRQLETLKEADFIACEDTRQTLKLLNHYDIKNRLISYHEHNIKQKGPELIGLLKEGNNIALVTDAGMPGISDPGGDLIRLCHEEGIKVTATPGPTAVITALVLSGLDSSKYVFYGFLPKDKKEQKMILERLATEYMTSVFYEAPHRLLKTLKLFREYIGDYRRICVVRELTKLHEEILCLKIHEAIEYFSHNEPRGEFVLIVEGIGLEGLDSLKIEEAESMTIEEHMEKYMAQGIDKKEAMKLVAKDRGVSKSEIYNRIMKK
jgi:16S rRNA (cytidine1402-2'-O)-methyltransferase